MAGLVLSALMWSFFGHADVIVTAQGTLLPDSEVRRFHAPVDGELANLYIAEGQPVSKGDVLARLNARGAIEAATNALHAQLKLEDAEREWKEFPEKKALMERKVAALKQARNWRSISMRTGCRKGWQSSRKCRERNFKKPEPESKTLVEPATLPGTKRTSTSGCSRCPAEAGYRSSRLRTRKTRCLAAENAHVGRAIQTQRARRSPKPGNIRSPGRSSRASGQELTRLQLQHDAAAKEIADTEEKLRLQLQTARLVAEGAARIKFENIDKENFLLIFAPVDGVITDVTSTQQGDKVQANTPLGGIAPKGARPVLKIEIAEQDRGLLAGRPSGQTEIQCVSLSALWLHQRHAELFSPATKLSPQTKQPVYEGRVTIDQDHYLVAETRYPLRYGMTATAEVVVRERRLIDLALDPFRQIGG